jgi:Pyruvate/2-oxoacid:ferredoxin oxidoreductase delta subunit
MEVHDARSKVAPFHWRFQVLLDRCIGCGVCMDTCPVATLDMSHPTRPGVDGTGLYPWMTEQPVQVRQCIGCWVCRTECPTDAILIEATDSEPQMQAIPPLAASPPSNPDRGWVPLSALLYGGLREKEGGPEPAPLPLLASMGCLGDVGCARTGWFGIRSTLPISRS